MAVQPEAGPSQAKRPRFGPGAQDGAGGRALPATLDVEKFAMARRTEISAMEKAMKTSRDSGAQRAFQSLPRHLRRRAASHHIRRLPKRLRAKAKMEIMHEKAKVIKKRKFRDLPLAKRRKLLRMTRLEILHKRQNTKAWLETHIWHAKRMKMKNVWGYRLAYTPTEKSFRPSYRASMHGAIVHDASYYQTIELKGQFEALKAILALVCDASAVPASSKRYSSGIRECQVSLYNVASWPLVYIGPATVIWDTPTSEGAAALRQLFIRFHPSILIQVSSAVKRALEKFQSSAMIAFEEQRERMLASSSILEGQGKPFSRPTEAETAAEDERQTAYQNVGMYHRNFCAFEVMGPMATDTIKACLKPVNGEKEALKKAWQSLPPPSAVPSGTILALDVYDPRLTFPPKVNKSDKAHDKRGGVQPSESLAAGSQFWSAKARKELHVPRYSKAELDERRAELLIPGTGLSAKAQDDRIPILLIQRSLSPATYQPSSASSILSSTPPATLSGWTILIPSGWGAAFFHSLVYADTRVGGLRERAQQHYEAGLPNFPEDGLTTTAYLKDVSIRAREEQQRWEKKPPAKRINYAKLGTENPWKPNWQKVVQDAWGEGSKQSDASDKGEAGKADKGKGRAVEQDQPSEGSGLLNTQREVNVNEVMQVEESAGQTAPLAVEPPASVPSASATTAPEEPEKPIPLWLLQGALLSSLLNQVQSSLLSTLSQTASTSELAPKLSSALSALIQHSRSKRSLDAIEASKIESYASQALVRVALHPVGRGTPKNNAIIYRMSDEQGALVMNRIRESREGKGGEGKAMRKRKDGPSTQAKGKGRMAQDGDAGGSDDEDEDDSNSDEEEGDIEENDAIELDPAYQSPSPDRLIGHITTGNMSLARGRGLGIGAISLYGLVGLMHDSRKRAHEDRGAGAAQQGRKDGGKKEVKEKRVLVLWRNGNSRICRAAWLEVLL